MPSVICASALRADVGVSELLALVFTARTYVVQDMNVKEINRLTMGPGVFSASGNKAERGRVRTSVEID
jgi:hypothetical protein